MLHIHGDPAPCMTRSHSRASKLEQKHEVPLLSRIPLFHKIMAQQEERYMLSRILYRLPRIESAYLCYMLVLYLTIKMNFLSFPFTLFLLFGALYIGVKCKIGLQKIKTIFFILFLFI